MCSTKMCDGCPFNYGSEESDLAQNYGCLPTPGEIIDLRTKLNKTWACHCDESKPCTGAIKTLQAKNLPCKVIDKQLVTELTFPYDQI